MNEIGPRLRCIFCKRPFGDANVFTEAGWIEARISGLCEACFDLLADCPDEDGPLCV